MGRTGDDISGWGLGTVAAAFGVAIAFVAIWGTTGIASFASVDAKATACGMSALVAWLSVCSLIGMYGGRSDGHSVEGQSPPPSPPPDAAVSVLPVGPRHPSPLAAHAQPPASTSV